MDQFKVCFFVAAFENCCSRLSHALTDEDIRLYLLSRYGIEVAREEVQNVIIKGFAGGSVDDDFDCIDLVEMVTILLIPTLLKASTRSDDLPEELVRPREGLIHYVLDMILHDVRNLKLVAPHNHYSNHRDRQRGAANRRN